MTEGRQPTSSERSSSSADRGSAERELRARLEEEKRRRRQFETRLKMLEHAVETMSTGVTVSDMDGRIIYVNPADARMHGYEIDELVGTEARRYRAPASPVAEGDPVEPWTRERIDTTKDGSRFPVRLTSGRLRDSQLQPLATVTVCEDLRERKQIQHALARHDLILEALGLAAEKFLAEASWESNVKEVLERLGRATGVDLIYITLLERVGPFAPQRFFLSWETPGSSEEHAVSEGLGLPARVDLFARWEDRLRDGETLHGWVDELPEEERQVLVSCGVQTYVVVPIFVESTLRGYLSLEDGDPRRDWSPAELQALRTAARAFGASIHKREAELKLQASEEQHRDLLENANDLIQSVSPDGHFLYVNRAWMETLGYGAGEVSTLRLWDVVKPEVPGDERDPVGSILSGEQEGRLEAIFVTKEGLEIIVEGSVSCRYVDGLPVSARGIFRDITERKRAERMIQEFISTVSHELRTPLTSIIASLGLLESGVLKKRPERADELVSVAHRNSKRLLHLINNLLDLQKISAGKMPFTIGTVTVRPVLSEALDDIRAFADTQEIGLTIAEVEGDLQVLADRDRLLQVLNNLLSNAIKFSPDGAEVTVSARRRDDRVMIAVSDQGPGIPEEFRAQLFDRFTQFDSGGKRRAGGSGLGLSIVQGLVEGMEGSVGLESEVGVGTTFEVDLPVPGAAEDEESNAD